MSVHLYEIKPNKMWVRPNSNDPERTDISIKKVSMALIYQLHKKVNSLFLFNIKQDV